MTDNEIRDLLLNAQEPVSPAVWKAVAAGMGRRRGVVPVWLWSTMAAAAVVVLGVFLFKPQQKKLEPFTPGRVLAASVTHSMPNRLAAVDSHTAKAPVAARPQPQPLTLVKEHSFLTAVNRPLGPAATVSAELPGSIVLPPTAPEPDYNSALNMLAFEEMSGSAMREVSLTASGNFQATSKAQALGRRAAAAGGSTQGEAITNPTEDRPGIPLSAGIGIKWYVAPRLAIGTGVRYTFVSRSFVGDYHGEGYVLSARPVDNMQHWIGVPLNVYYDFVSTRRLKVHAFAGGGVDYILANKFTIHNNGTDIPWHKTQACFQWSAAAGAGVEFMITPHVGLFADPGLRYYFNQAAGADLNGLPVRPLRFTVEAGVRFSL